jgi:hypothetical protein
MGRLSKLDTDVKIEVVPNSLHQQNNHNHQHQQQNHQNSSISPTSSSSYLSNYNGYENYGKEFFFGK